VIPVCWWNKAKKDTLENTETEKQRWQREKQEEEDEQETEELIVLDII
jgi:hypothetical protein